MSRRTTRTLPAVALAALLAVSGCASSSSGSTSSGSGLVDVQRESSALRGSPITNTYPLPGQSFTDTAGSRYVPSRDAAKPVTLVYFGYTHCPDVCNVVLANVAAALRRADTKVRDRTELLFVTTDPARDSRSAVRGYLDRFDSDYVGLRAPLATTKAAAAALHISYEGTSADASGGYTVEHGTQVTAFRHGQAAVVWSAETSVADLRADLTRLAGR